MRARRSPDSRVDLRDPLTRASLLLTLAALLWIPQAGALAWGVGRIAAGEGAAAVWAPAGAALLFGALRALLEDLGAGMAHGAARAEVRSLRAKAVAALGRRSPLDKTQASSGLASSLLAEQAEALIPWLSRWRPARFKSMILPLAIFACVLWFSWAAALALAMAAPLIPVFMALVGWRAQAVSEAHMARLGEMNGYLLDRLRGLATIRDLGAVEGVTARVRAEAQDLKTRAMAVLRIAFLSSAVLEFFSALGVALAAVYVGFHLLGEFSWGVWGERLSLAEGLFVLMLAPAFFEPLREISAVWHDRAAGEAARKALLRLEDSGPEVSTLPLAPALLRAPGVRIEALDFAPAFAGYGLEAAPGERVALMGPSGSGKSTLLALIGGLAEPQAGALEFPGAPKGLRPQIAWFGQTPHVFAGSLAANIALGRELSPEALREALSFARLERAAALHGAAPLGEGGLGLSGGEAHRLALARLKARPEARLILADEPTAHLDSETAAEILAGLLELAEGRTLVVATHDPAVARRMDRVIRLEPLAADKEAAA
ncbi:thiol reductant ABC exporter subunit CydD [Neomegalonema sp.]|uniref:thiol reductant ABC exporter subunit CydD n=1 Tax=Neomegalonema sp. TaxID=2039713 RepID=UPI00262C9153|nr:thiol reductant ABC exporter subunit CydD [Neomegalonema sp.]MDD2869568.1 thiol reductant ABC exporter subunit CydD [Neomegalonema sp.]